MVKYPLSHYLLLPFDYNKFVGTDCEICTNLGQEVTELRFSGKYLNGFVEKVEFRWDLSGTLVSIKSGTRINSVSDFKLMIPVKKNMENNSLAPQYDKFDKEKALDGWTVKTKSGKLVVDLEEIYEPASVYFTLTGYVDGKKEIWREDGGYTFKGEHEMDLVLPSTNYITPLSIAKKIFSVEVEEAWFKLNNSVKQSPIFYWIHCITLVRGLALYLNQGWEFKYDNNNYNSNCCEWMIDTDGESLKLIKHGLIIFGDWTAIFKDRVTAELASVILNEWETQLRWKKDTILKCAITGKL